MVEIPSCYPDPCGLTCVILARRLFYIFLDFLFLLCRKKMCMHGIYFLFYVTIVNTPMGFYTPLIYSHGA
jgi:hypothetical protein